MRIASYVSGHGFGHAVRQAELARALGARGVEVVFVSNADCEAFEPMPAAARLEHGDVDVGVLQTSSLDVDEAGTLAAFAAFAAGWKRAAEDEARRLDRLRADLVIADIAPLGLLAARRSGRPAVLFANFTWDWIYRAWSDRHPEAGALADLAAEAFSTAGRVFVPPLSGGMSPDPRREDVPLVVRRARRGRAELRGELGVAAGEILLFVAFGGFGPPSGAAGATDLDPARVRAFGYTDLGWPASLYTRVDRRRHEHPDLVAAADVVLGKPGYGTVAECIVHGTPMLWLPRERFPEAPVLERAIRDHAGGAPLARADFAAGRIACGLRAALASPPARGRLAGDGAEVVADRLASTGKRP